VHPVDLPEEPDDWRQWAAEWLRKHGVAAERMMLVAGPSPRNPKANHRIELMRLNVSDELRFPESER
jgi:pyruvate kinase